MAKLPVLSGKEMIAALKKAGFVELRQKGSHVSLEKVTLSKTYRAVVPLHQELGKGTILDILQQAELSGDAFFELLEW